MIEAAFEGGIINGNLNPTESDRCADFNVAVGSREDILRAIMRNIIKHRGEFKP